MKNIENNRKVLDIKDIHATKRPMSKKLILFIALAIVGLVANFAQAQIVTIPDANFKACLLAHNPVIDTNGDGEIQVTEAQAFNVTGRNRLNCAGKGITDLTGIEAFTGIIELRCEDNELTGLLDLSHNTTLVWLYCQNNELTGIDVSNSNMQIIWCQNNKLTSLDLSNSPGLSVLYCQKNELTSLDVSNKPLLAYLDCSANKLTSLDVSDNTALMGLNCYENKLTSLDLTQNTALNVVYCYDNELTSLDLGNNTGLWLFSCYKNKLTSLDVTQNTGLLYLYCHQNELTQLDVTKNTALINFFCQTNKLTSLDVTKNTKLQRFVCQENKLSDLDVTQNKDLLLLYCNDNNPFANGLDVTQNTNLVWLNCANIGLEELDLTKNTALEQLFCDNNNLDELDLAVNTKLKILSASSNQLDELDLTKNTALEQLSFLKNELTDIDLSNNRKLRILSARNNKLTELDLRKVDSLRWLFVDSNRLESLNLRNGKNTLIDTAYLRLGGNPMLRCIEVDDAAYSNANWTKYKDTWACFSESPCEKPLFDPIPAFCASDPTPPLLPDESKNGFKGKWDPPSFDLSSASTKTYVFTPDNCAHKTAMTVTIMKPTVTLVPDTLICANETVTLKASGADTYSWDGGATFVSDDSMVVSPATTTTYKVIGKDANGCSSDEQEVTVTVNAVTAGNIDADQDVCVDGTPVPLYPAAMPDNADGAISHRWEQSTDFGGSWNPASGANTGVIYTPNALSVTTMFQRVTISTKDGLDCEDASNPVTITVNPKPVVDIKSDAANNTICAGESVKLTASGALTYAWTANGTPFGNSDAEQTVSPTANTTYKAIGTDANGCVAEEKEIDITVNPRPVVDVTSDAANNMICEGESVKLTASGALTYAWTANGTPFGNSDAEQTVSPTANTTYKAIGTDANGCVSLEKEIEITVNPTPIVDIKSDAANNTICAGESVKLTASGAQTYVWTGPGTAGTGAEQTVSPTANTTYKVIGTDAYGCATVESEIEIVVNPSITPDFDQVNPICQGEKLDPLPTVSKDYVSGTWSPAMDNMNTTEYTFTPNPGQCAAPVKMTVVVSACGKAPEVGMSIIKDAVNPDRNYPLGDVIEYRILVVNTGTVALTGITLRDENADVKVVGTITTLPAGQGHSFTARHTVTKEDLNNGYVLNIAKAFGKDTNGDEVTAESVYTGYSAHHVPVDPSCPTCTVVRLSPIEAVDDLYELAWLDGGYSTGCVLDNDSLSGAAVDPADIVLIPLKPDHAGLVMRENGTVSIDPTVFPGRYEYPYRICEFANPSRCSEAVAVIVIHPNEERSVFVPSAFTPNGDGVNDTFEILGIDQFERVELSVFNRWGQEVFRNDDCKNGKNWDAGGLLAGTYYYAVWLHHKDGKTEVVKGSVLVVK